MTREEQLHNEAIEVMPGGISRNTLYLQPRLYYAERAQGAYITDVSGKQKVDFSNNIASLLHGHAHPAIVAAVSEQLQRGTAYTLGTEVEIRHAQLLCERVPSFDKIRFVNSGTEAVMAMIKTARAFTGKPKVAKAEGGYHGSFDVAEVSQTASPQTWGDIDNPVSVPLAAGTPQTVLDNVVVFHFNDIERTLNILDQHAGEIGCVLLDPVPHRIGMVPASDEFVRALYDWTRRNNALLCFDEVICFRSDYEGAQSMFSVKPDLTSLGKIIGGGFPIGAFAGRKDVMDILDPGGADYRYPLSGTFSANPISMTAGHEAMKMFDRDAVARLNTITANAREQVLEAGRIAGIPLTITGTGSMFRMHFSDQVPVTYRDAYADPAQKQMINRFIGYLYDKGVILINSCTAVFSTVITQKEVDTLTDTLLSGFRYIKPDLKL